MISIFNTNHPSVSLWLFLLAALSLYTGIPTSLESNLAIEQWLFGLIPYPLFWYGINVLSLGFCAVLWNNALSEKGLIPRNTHLPAMFFLLFAALFQKLIGFGVFLFLLPLLAGFIFMLQLDNELKKTNNLFFIGFYLGLAALWHPLLYLLFPFVVVVLISHQFNQLNFYLLLHISYLLPIYFLWTGFFVLAEGNLVWKEISQSFNFSNPFAYNYGLTEWLALGCLAVWFLLGALSQTNSEDWRISKKRTWYLSTLMLAIYLLLLAFTQGTFNAYLLFVFVLVSLPASTLYLKKKIGFWRKTLFYLFLAIIVFVNFYEYLANLV